MSASRAWLPAQRIPRRMRGSAPPVTFLTTSRTISPEAEQKSLWIWHPTEPSVPNDKPGKNECAYWRCPLSPTSQFGKWYVARQPFLRLMVMWRHCYSNRRSALIRAVMALCFCFSAVTGTLSSFEHAHAHGAHADHDHDDDFSASTQSDHGVWSAIAVSPDGQAQSPHDGVHEHSINMTPLLTSPPLVVWEPTVLRSRFGYDRNVLSGIAARMLERPPRKI